MFVGMNIETTHMEDPRSVLSNFDLEGTVLEVRPLGSGLINDTYRVLTSEGSPDYVLQRINHSIFRDVDLLQSNIEAVTRHIRRKLVARGEEDIDRKVLRFVPVRGGGKTYFFDSESYWRVSVFIPDAYTFDTVDPVYSRFAGEAFGSFEAMLSDIPDRLGETIPDFHNMELRARQLRDAVRTDPVGRMADPEVRSLLGEILSHEEQMCLGERLHREGKLPKRICHCDTKVNNVLFDADGRILCVIDLDTVMPSFVFSDFGDFLRTAASTLPEDDPAWEDVSFRRDIFEAFAEGYLSSAGSFLTPVERDNLPYGALLFPYMQAVRFFADYIGGDTYYKIRYPDHNLVRTRNQMALYRSMLSDVDYMASVIARM